MQKFAAIFGAFFGLIISIHGLALAFLQSPLIDVSNKRNSILYFYAAEAFFGERAAWVMSGLLWTAIGFFLIYFSIGNFPRTKPAIVQIPEGNKSKRRRRKKNGKKRPN